ncbi:hypothetical protein TNCV_1579081 [Trichonephila clavipes]|nr:hypothetical protein TNCV_1579081 [Trichonephila clavipes]
MANNQSVGATSGCFAESNHCEVGGRPQCDKCGCRDSELLTASFHDFGDNFKLQEQLSGGSVVVVHEDPHPQMTGTLSYRPEETDGRQREKSLDTRHRRLDDRCRVLPWPEDCTVVVCCTTPYDRRFSLNSDSHGILIWEERGSLSSLGTSFKGTGMEVAVFSFGEIMLDSRTDLTSTTRFSQRDPLVQRDSLPYVRLLEALESADSFSWTTMHIHTVLPNSSTDEGY